MSTSTQFLLIFFGGMLLFVSAICWIYIKTKRDEKKRQNQKEKEKETDNNRRDDILNYLDNLYNQTESEEAKHLIFKLKNRWKIIYKHSRASSSRLPPHPQLMSAAADRDNFEVKLMDLGIEINYP